MIGRAKRRFYRFGLAAGICFLLATMAYDVSEVGATSLLFIIAPGIMEFFGCVSAFTAFEALAYPDDYDRFEEVFPSHRYGIIFYVVASAMAIATLFLLVWIYNNRSPTSQEQLVIIWGLFVIGGCVFFGFKSRSE